MKRILVAYDGTAGAKLALEDMARAGFGNDAEARVVTVADVWLPKENLTPGQLAAHPSYASTHQRATAASLEADNAAAEGARLLQEMFPKWTVSHQALAESPAWGILAESRKWGADLLVIGSHGRSLLQKFFLGSVSQKVAAEAECSVRVVRSRQSPAESQLQILVALDGSSDSQTAVDEAAQRQWPNGTTIHLVAVIDDKLRSTLFRELSARPQSGSIEQRLTSMMEQAADRFVREGQSVKIHMLEGDPKDVLLGLANKMEIDTIFMGATGMDHKERLHLGTLASAICSRADCTVELSRKRQAV